MTNSPPDSPKTTTGNSIHLPKANSPSSYAKQSAVRSATQKLIHKLLPRVLKPLKEAIDEYPKKPLFVLLIRLNSDISLLLIYGATFPLMAVIIFGGIMFII
jgi:hypothetical protein